MLSFTGMLDFFFFSLGYFSAISVGIRCQLSRNCESKAACSEIKRSDSSVPLNWLIICISGKGIKPVNSNDKIKDLFCLGKEN